MISLSIRSRSSNAALLHDKAAFARFYERTHRSVFRYATALCHSQEDAEDVTAEAFLRAWRARDGFSGDEEAAVGWIISIARNMVIDRYRSAGAKHNLAPLDDETPDGAPSIDEVMVADEQMSQVFELIRQLPERQRDILILRHVLGWQVKRIGQHLGMAENTVSVNLGRAIRHLGAQLRAERGIP